MQRQTSPCAFTNSCNLGGPRYRMEGTTREYCSHHAQSLQMPISSSMDVVAASVGGNSFTSFVMGGGRSSGKGRWPTFAGSAARA